MNFTTLLQFVQERTTLSITVAVIAFTIFTVVRHNYGFYVWYFITILAALSGAVVSDHSAYFIVFLLGGATAFAEIISKFSSEPLKALETPHAFIYHLLNGAIAAFTLKVLYLYGVANTTDLDQLKNVVVAGLGSMLIMRSKLFNIKVSGEDVSFGPEQIIKIFFRFMEDAIDRVRARWRIDFVKRTLGNIKFEAVHEYCLTMLYSAQALDKDRRQACSQEIDKIRNSTVKDTELRSFNLGFILMNEMGEDFVTELFGKPKPEWLISAPKPTESKYVNVNSDGALSSLSSLPFVGTKEEIVPYFAYGSSMCERKLLETLAWKEDDKRLIKDMNPQAAKLSGYKLVFNKRCGDAPNLEGAPNIVIDESQMVEGVLYQMPKTVADFLRSTEKGYHQKMVDVKVRDKEKEKEKEKAGNIKLDEPIYQTISALTFVADAESSFEGLKPSKESLEVLKEGAKEHDLDEAYLQKLNTIETLPPAAFTQISNVGTLNVQAGNTEATM